jgi:hypothetical protein
MNSYPFLNNKHKPIFTGELADIVPRVRHERVIDISSSPLVPATTLRHKLEMLHRAGELDGGLPIIRNDILVGLIPAPDLEFALDSLDNEGSDLWPMCPTSMTRTMGMSTRLISPRTSTRHLLRWIVARRWIWCTNYSSSSACGTSVCFVTVGMLAW